MSEQAPPTPTNAASGDAEIGTSTLGGTSTPGDRGLVARAGLALVVANVRYWTGVAPVVRGELRRWERRARAIDDPELRALALQKLRGEGFHAEAAAMLATLAPRAHRRDLVEAIVALELLFDYLDGLTERPSDDPLGEGERLFAAYTDAVTVRSETTPRQSRSGLNDDPAEIDDLRVRDSGYLDALSETVGGALARLPTALAITEVAQRNAALGGQAQTRMHAAAALGTGQVEAWARREAEGTGLQWRELLAGAASSVLVLHALIAAAADPRTTRAEADEIASAYLSTCVLLTLLDGLVDHDEDMRSVEADRPGYLSFYEGPEELSQHLIDAAQRAAAQTRALPNGPHHAITLVGVVAYYTSAPGARGELAAPIVERLQAELAPLISPTLALMRGWRLAKRMLARNRRAPRRGGLASFLDKPRFIDKTRGSGGCNEV
jgi:tetraprenyl-beta-curcumene synthase